MEDKSEIICEECGKSFLSADSEVTLCQSCWEKIVFGDEDGDKKEGQ